MYTKDIETLIMERRSTRNYSDLQVDQETLDSLLAFASAYDNDFYRFKIVRFDKQEGERMGTYGLFKNTETFLVAIGIESIRDNLAMTIQFGKDFEAIILKATDLDIDTCWMGMSYEESKLSMKAGASKNERIIMATPLGYSAGIMSRERIARFAMGADKRLAWHKLFYQGDFNKPMVKPESLLDPEHMSLEMLRLSPSAGNSQPWRIIKVEGAYKFYIKPKKFYESRKDMRISFAYNDLGISLFHFEETMKAKGLNGSFHMIPQNEHKLKDGYIYTGQYIIS